MPIARQIVELHGGAIWTKPNVPKGSIFHVVLPTAGTCPAGTRNVYRVFSNRADANHRYMVDAAIRDQMTARGWLAEGDGPNLVVMCAPG